MASDYAWMSYSIGPSADIVFQDVQPLLSPAAANVSVSVAWADIASGLTDRLSVLSSDSRLYPYLDLNAPLCKLQGLEHPKPPTESHMTAAELVSALQAGGRNLYHSCQLASISRNTDRSAHGTLAEKLVPKLLTPIKEGAAKAHHPFGGAQLNLFASSAHSCTPAHYDSRHNSIVQLEGTKRVWLWSPEEASSIFTWFPSASEAHRTAIEALGWPAGKPPSAFSDRAKYFELAPGDRLFVPAHWAHQVCSGHEAAASLSLWVTDAAAGKRLEMARLGMGDVPFEPSWDPGERLSAALHVFALAAGNGDPREPETASTAAQKLRGQFGASFHYEARPATAALPARHLPHLCGIGLSEEARRHLWGDASDGLPPAEPMKRIHATVGAAMRYAGGPHVRWLLWSQWLLDLVLASLAIPTAGGRPAPEQRAALVPHIVARCLSVLDPPNATS